MGKRGAQVMNPCKVLSPCEPCCALAWSAAPPKHLGSRQTRRNHIKFLNAIGKGLGEAQARGLTAGAVDPMKAMADVLYPTTAKAK